jgi:osmotically-inducible protein OsmY
MRKKGEMFMRKPPNRNELMETMASLFSLNTLLFASRTDIESSAKQSYVFKTFLKGDDITIQHKDGVAILIGSVSEESHKLLARETLASLPGVTGVYSKLEEQWQVPAVNMDAWLAGKVKSTLLFHQSVNAAETEIIAKNGTIILRGKAASSAQKDLTAEYAKDVEGVNRVKNEMTVTTAIEKTKEKVRRDADTADESIDDGSVTALVKTTLSYHRSTRSLGITVETRDGVVKLEGEAGSWDEKNLVSKRVIDVPGVKMVFNNMAIRRTVPVTITNTVGSEPTLLGGSEINL